MYLTLENFPIPFARGLDTKTDPFQVSPGKFLSLQNTIFDKAGLLQKRNGFGQLTSLPSSNYYSLTTFNGNLTAISPTNFEAYASGSESWVNKGSMENLSLSVLSLIKNNSGQTQIDAAVSSNNLVCVTYKQSTTYYYAVLDATTGQNIVAPTAIPTTGVVTYSPKVFVLGNYFIIVFDSVISATNHLQYVAVNFYSLIVGTATDVSTAYTPASTGSFDGVVANGKLYLAWNGSDGGGAIRVTSLSTTLVLATTITFASRIATLISVCADLTGTTPVIYIVIYNSGTSTGYVMAVNQILSVVHIPVQVIASGTYVNINSTAQNKVCTFLGEITNAYSYDSGIPSNYIKINTITESGTVGSATDLIRSVGLASKGFIINNNAYFMAVYRSPNQPTYFLISNSGKVISKLAYENAGSYYITGLPNVTVIDDLAYIPYLFQDLLLPVNKTQGLSNSAVYTQTGINLAEFNFNTNINTAEIGKDLHLSGGFLWMYDGYLPVEHNFFLWPDSVEAVVAPSLSGGSILPQTYYYQCIYQWTDNQGNIFNSAPSIPISVVSSSFTGYAFTITASSATVGATYTNNAITFTVLATIASATTLYMSGAGAPAVSGTLTKASGTGDSTIDFSTFANSNTITVNVPYLRLTYKISNPVKIVIYRWSTAQQSYYQITSISSPSLNSVTSDSLAFVDTYADSSIVGNSLIYTTGGVVEDIAAPSTSIMCLYKSRLILVDGEDPNLLWYSKQVIEATPVEMSDLFTIYVAPTTGSQFNTGPISALGAMDDRLVIFKRAGAIFYMVFDGPDNTGANNDIMDPVFITSTVGCNNPNSIVLTPAGLMFQSDKGIWLLGRDLSTTYIGAPVEKFNSNEVLSALTIPGTNQVRFILDNGVTLMYDYYYEQWGSFYGISNLSSTLYQGLHSFIDQYGRVFQETPGLYLDGNNPVLMQFQTSWFNLAGLQGLQRAIEFYFLGTYISPHKLNIQIGYNYNPTPTQTNLIVPDNYSPPYGSDTLYGGSAYYGGYLTLEQWRIFFDQQKVQSVQIYVQEIFDSSYSTIAGAGFTMSGINMTVGMLRSRPLIPQSRTVG